MRLFVGIDLPLDIKDYFYNLQKELKKDNLAKIKWVSKKNLHLTLKFLGDVSNVNLIVDALKNIKFFKFNIKLDSLGYFPSGSKIKIIWVGLKDDKIFIQLQKLIDESTIGFGDLKLG